MKFLILQVLKIFHKKFCKKFFLEFSVNLRGSNTSRQLSGDGRQLGAEAPFSDQLPIPMFSIEPPNLTPDVSPTIELCRIARPSLIASSEFDSNVDNTFKEKKDFQMNELNANKNSIQKSVKHDSTCLKHETNFRKDSVDESDGNALSGLFKLNSNKSKSSTNDYDVIF